MVMVSWVHQVHSRERFNPSTPKERGLEDRPLRAEGGKPPGQGACLHAPTPLSKQASKQSVCVCVCRGATPAPALAKERGCLCVCARVTGGTLTVYWVDLVDVAFVRPCTVASRCLYRCLSLHEIAFAMAQDTSNDV